MNDIAAQEMLSRWSQRYGWIHGGKMKLQGWYTQKVHKYADVVRTSSGEAYLYTDMEPT